MKAIVYEEYGAPEVLHLKELEKPAIKTDEILVRIHATTVSSADARLRSMNVPRGFRLITRLVFGFTKPKKGTLGQEFAGEVVAVGKAVTEFKEGDAVFGSSGKMGCYAEYVAVPESGPIVLKPANLSDDEAASIPFGALSSLVYLRDLGKIKAGQKVLVNGASGSLGTFAVQLAKYFGAEVTGVCSTGNISLVKSIGADHVVDYTQTDFATRDDRYDIIFDTVGNLTFSHAKKALTLNGRLLLAVAGIPQFLQMLWIGIVSRKKVIAGVAEFKKEDLAFIKELIESGSIKPVIDSRYPLEKTVEAHRYVDKGHKKGGVVITLADN